MSTTEARVLVPAVQTSEILGSTHSINSIQPENTTSTRRTHSKFCQHSEYSSYPSVNIFCKQMEMELSNRCTNGQNILHTPSILRIFRVLRVFVVSTDGMRLVRAVPAVQSPETLEVQGKSTVSNPKILRVSAVLNLEILRVPAVFRST